MRTPPYTLNDTWENMHTLDYVENIHGPCCFVLIVFGFFAHPMNCGIVLHNGLCTSVYSNQIGGANQQRQYF